MLAQGEVVDERAVRLMQVGHAGVSDDRSGIVLLALAGGGKLERVRLGILTTLVAAGAADEPADGAGVDPSCGRRRWTEVGVVGMGRDDHESGRPPDVLRSSRTAVRFDDCGRRRIDGGIGRCVGHASAACASSSAASTSAACPSGFTFAQTRAIRPAGSTRNVVRALPQ